MNDLFPNLQQQLNKLSIRKMQFQITKVDFIIDENVYDESLTPPTSEELAENYVGEIWEANDEDDLMAEIENDAAHRVDSIDYRIILN
jgi:hypothetical protein|tara:strand:- start:310 stop:573 length:264 start_codon:yes stop_codon:yes gene_type:complete